MKKITKKGQEIDPKMGARDVEINYVIEEFEGRCDVYADGAFAGCVKDLPAALARIEEHFADALKPVVHHFRPVPSTKTQQGRA